MVQVSRRALLTLVSAALPAGLAMPARAHTIRRPNVLNGRRCLHYDVFTEWPQTRQEQIVSVQGVKIGGPSRIHTTIDQAGRETTRAHAGGTSVLVGEGASGRKQGHRPRSRLGDIW